MTCEEALKRVNEMLEKRAFVFSAIYQISFWLRIKEALKKQVAKKSQEDKYGHLGCPNCGYIWCLNKEDKLMLEEIGMLPNYCSRCGQAIDWSDVCD